MVHDYIDDTHDTSFRHKLLKARLKNMSQKDTINIGWYKVF